MSQARRDSGETTAVAEAARRHAESPGERVIRAADDLFYARGIQAVGMDDVRNASGVSLRRLYGEFPGKEDLVLAVLRRRHETWTDGLAAAVGVAPDARGKLLAIYDFLASWFSDETFRGCGFINAFGELGATSAPVAEFVRDHKRSFQDYVAGLVESAGVDRQLAPQLAILAEGAQTTAAIAGTPDAAVHARRAAEILIEAASRAS